MFYARSWLRSSNTAMSGSNILFDNKMQYFFNVNYSFGMQADENNTAGRDDMSSVTIKIFIYK